MPDMDNDQISQPVSPMPAQQVSQPIVPPQVGQQPPVAPQVAQAAPPTPGQVTTAAGAAPQKPGSFFKNMSHAFMGSVLGALAGEKEVTGYTTDETGKMTPQTRDLSTGDKLKKIAGNALIGLAAGSQAPQQKSGAASALAGLGAGVQAQKQEAQQQAQQQKEDASKSFEQQQRATMQKYNIAHLNALTTSLYFGNIKAENDANPQFAANQSLMDAVKSSPKLAGSLREMTAEEVAEQIKKDPHFAATHIIKPLGYAAVQSPQEGGTVTGMGNQPQKYMRMMVFDGTTNGATLKVPDEFAQDVNKYGPKAGITNAAGIKPGQELTLDEYTKMSGAIDAEKKKELDGWINPTGVWHKDADGKEEFWQQNSVTKEVKPWDLGNVPIAAQEQADKGREATAGANLKETEAKDKPAIDKADIAEKLASAEEKRQVARTAAAEFQLNAHQLSTLTGAEKDAAEQKLMSLVPDLSPVAKATLRSTPTELWPAVFDLAFGQVKLNSFPTTHRKGVNDMPQQRAEGLARMINPKWSKDLADQVTELKKNFGPGQKSGIAVDSFNQFMVHAGEAKDTVEQFRANNTLSPWLNKSLNALKENAAGNPQVGVLLAALEAPQKEYMNFLNNNHASTESDRETAKHLLDYSKNADQNIGVMSVMIPQAIARLGQLDEDAKTITALGVPNIVRAEARAAAEKFGLGDRLNGFRTGDTWEGGFGSMGKSLQPAGYTGPTSGQPQNPQSGQPAQLPPGIPPDHKAIVKDPQGNIAGYVDGKTNAYVALPAAPPKGGNE